MIFERKKYLDGRTLGFLDRQKTAGARLNYLSTICMYVRTAITAMVQIEVYMTMFL